MEPLQLKHREPGTMDIECWDDDEDIQGIEDLHIRNASVATTATFVSARSQHHRESLQSRLSNKSDWDEEKDLQLHLPTDDQDSTIVAIADAKSKGIPIPDSVPASALIGGTIRRLGGKKSKKAIGDDWENDLELPSAEGLKLRINDGKEFPESLRQLSTAVPPSPTKGSKASPIKSSMSFSERLQMFNKSQPSMLNTSRIQDPSGFMVENSDTNRVPKQRSAASSSVFDSPAKPAKSKKVESFDDDLELPADGELKLSTRRDHTPKTPASQQMDEFDLDWADGSQGSYGTQGNLRRSGRSNRSSSMSARSPSVFSPTLSSCLTAESEDEGLEGLVLPEGPLKLQDALHKRMNELTPEETGEKKLAPSPMPAPRNDDFFTGIEIGDGDIFGSGKLTLNRNIKHKAQRQISPKRPAMTLTFTSKPPASLTRIPKPTNQERARSKLEPVMENVGQIQQLNRARSRLDNHSAQSSINSIPASLSSNAGPATPTKRILAPRASRELMRTDTNPTTAQMLKAKRSLPILSGRDPASPSRIQQPPPYQRPTSRTAKPLRTTPQLRPKTPIDRSESSLATARRAAAPHNSTTNMAAPNRLVTNKSSRTFHRPTSSENSTDSITSSTRSISRTSNVRRQHSPVRRDVATDALAKAAATKRQLTKPLRRRAYGDGNELDAFDDLPTSSTAESKYRKAPAVGKLPSSPALRKAYSHNNVLQQSASRPSSTVPPPSPMKPDGKYLPRFAQSTAASAARKQRLGAVSPEALRRPPHAHNEASSSTTSLVATYRLQPPPAPNSTRHANTSKRPAKSTQQKPHLIKQLGSGAHESKSLKGMHYNPTLFRWEGNEHALAPFDVPPPSSPKRNTPTPASKQPALIANVGSAKGVQVVGGMVFDPRRMCWLKLAPQQGQAQGSFGRERGNTTASSGVESLATEDDEDDPFAGFEELSDNVPGAGGRQTASGSGPIKDPGSDEEWLVSEEFDVGPDFVRRQRTEEVKWKRRMEGWRGVLTGPRFDEAGRWALRDLVLREHERRAMH